MAHLSILIRARDSEAAEVKAGEIKRLVESCLQVVRNMSLLLRPSIARTIWGLVPALQWQAKEVSKRSGLRVKVVAEEVSEDLPEETQRPAFIASYRRRCIISCSTPARSM